MREFYTSMTADEQYWIARIILKDLKISLSEKSILPKYHPDAFRLFQVCSDLREVCKQLKNLKYRLPRIEISVGKCFDPQRSLKRTPDEVIRIMCGEKFWIETKLDGWRIQMHYNNGNFQWFSRSRKDLSEIYGTTFNSGALTFYIKSCFTESLKSCVIDGEMCVYNSKLERIEPFGLQETAGNEVLEAQRGVSNREITLHPCFFVFDLVYLNGNALAEKPLEVRYKLLSEHVIEMPTYFQLLPHEVKSTKQEIFESLERHMLNCEEGIMIKDPRAYYSPGIEQTSWTKIKPEYIEALNDDVDVILVAGCKLITFDGRLWNWETKWTIFEFYVRDYR